MKIHSFFFSILLFTSLNSVWAQPQLSGALNGVLIGDTTYIVIQPIWINSGDTLTIEPGAILIFTQGTHFEIHGCLYAIGNEEDSIKFLNSEGRIWYGIDFDSSSNDNRLHYCYITGSINSGICCRFSTLEVSNSTIINNSSSSGGGICCDLYNTISLSNCVIEGNFASYYGGGIYLYYSDAYIFNCVIDFNGAYWDGGGLYCFFSPLELIESNILNNHTEGFGGGIEFRDSDLFMESCSIIENNSINYGAGIYFDEYFNQCLFNIENCEFTGNVTETCGGGFYGNGSPNFSDCDFNSNSADSGGGIFSRSSNMVIDNCNFNYNTAFCVGGGLYVYSSETLIANSDFIGNNAILGGGIFFKASENEISDCSIITNTAYVGGGIAFQNSIPVVARCVLIGNIATYRGGGVSSEGSEPAFINCTIFGNSAVDNGSFLSGVWYSFPSIFNSIISDNSGGYCLYLLDSEIDTAEYNCSYNNGNFIINEPPQGFGILEAVNANGDSCDVYYNIFLDPLFINPQNGDFNLQSNSPCIDAGDPNSPLDPDSTIADIGAFYFDQSTGVENLHFYLFHFDFCLYPCYPNPFNPTTTIRFTLDKTLPARLIVYNQLGQEVWESGFRNWELGENKIIWNAEGLSSGMYYIQLIVDGGPSAVKPAILLK